MKGKRNQQVGAAKIAWITLTEEALLEIEGWDQRLASLAQKRYAITQDEAKKQVKHFF